MSWIESVPGSVTRWSRARQAFVTVLFVAVGLIVLSRPALADERRLSLPDAITTALANNRDLHVAREDVGIASQGVELARSTYDPSFVGRLFAARDVLPGSATDYPSTDHEIGGDAGLVGRLITGLEYSLSLALSRETHTDPFSTIYDPATTTSLTLSVTQPLLRGAWRPGNQEVIVVASLRKQQSEHLLRAQLERTVATVELAYWNLVRAHREREARQASLQLAREQLEESRRLVRLGAQSQLDSVEAEAGVSRRAQELQSSNEDVVEAEGVLLDVLQVRVGDRGWSADDIVIPVDNPEVLTVSTSLEQHVELARKNRPDLIAAERLTEAESIALEVADNRKRPALDLVARAGLIGFAGTLADTYATAGVNRTDGGLDPPYFTDPETEGGLAKSFGNLASGGNYGVYLGIRLELPIRNQAAEARHAIQRHELEKARIAQRSLHARIENEVRTSLNRLKANAAIVSAADESVVLTSRLLEGTRRRFRNDASTSFDVLRILDELTRSKIEAARARARYRIALSRLAQANGTLLRRLGILVRPPARR